MRYPKGLGTLITDWRHVFDERIPSGAMWVYPHSMEVRMNPDAARWTLAMNAGGPILPPNRTNQ